MFKSQGSTKPGVFVLLRRIGSLWWAYVKGQLLVALCMGGMAWLLALGLGMQWPFWVGAFAGLFQSQTVYGPIVALIAMAGVALWKGSTVLTVEPWLFSLIAVGSLFLLQQVSTLFIEPHLMGKRLSIRPIVVLLAVIVGGIVGNIVGAFIAVPVLATVREVIWFTRYWLGAAPSYPPDELTGKIL